MYINYIYIYNKTKCREVFSQSISEGPAAGAAQALPLSWARGHLAPQPRATVSHAASRGRARWRLLEAGHLPRSPARGGSAPSGGRVGCAQSALPEHTGKRHHPPGKQLQMGKVYRDFHSLFF